MVAGFTAGKGSRSDSFGGLVLGDQGPAGLSYRGRVGGGLTGAEAEALRQRLASLVVPGSPFSTPTPDDRAATWVRPEVHVLVEYLETSSSGVLRQPVFKGVVREQRPVTRNHAVAPWPPPSCF